MRYVCENCGQNYEVRDSREGEIVNCQKCGKPMRLPEVRSGYKIITNKPPSRVASVPPRNSNIDKLLGG